MDSRITLNTYLSNFSKNRLIDNVIRQWFYDKYGIKHHVKTKDEWDSVINEFYSQTEKK